jgi:phospholipase C
MYESKVRARPLSLELATGGVAVLAFVLCMGALPGALAQSVGSMGAPRSMQPTSQYLALIPNAPPLSENPFKHVVIIDMENHAFDNYFGTYCETIGTYCSTTANGTPPGTCLPLNPAKGATPCIKPFLFTSGTANTVDLDHGWNSSHQAYNNGSMNGFYLAEGAHNQTMGYYNNSVIPAYWDLAEQYSLADYFFSSTLTYSLPNHWFLLAGQAPQASLGSKEFNSLPSTPLTALEQKYLNEANGTQAIDDLLVNSSVSWKFYDKTLAATYGRAVTQRTVFSFWDPLASKAQSYTPAFASHFLARTAFATAARSGTLPNVSWVIPDMQESDHPPFNVTQGMDWAMSQIEAVEASPEWSSTVVFLTWDEYGGFYDSVPPPQVDGNGYGFRVPLLVISPYSRENYVDHQLGSFDSLLKFTEWTFGLANLTARDGNAEIPWESFDFNATAQTSLTFPNLTHIAYPLAFHTTKAPSPPANFTASVGGTNVTLRWSEPVGGTPVTLYKVFYGPTGNSWTNTFTVNGAANGVLITNLVAHQSYAFHVRSSGPTSVSSAVNVTGVTPLDPRLSVTPAPLPIASWLIGAPVRSELHHL